MNPTPRHPNRPSNAWYASTATAALALCSLLAPPPAAAALTYSAKVYAETLLRVSGRPDLWDGRVDPVAGGWRDNPIDAAASASFSARTRDTLGNDLFVQVLASARANSGRVSVSASSDQVRSTAYPIDFGVSKSQAGARMQLDSLVTGAPGTVGKAVVTGNFWAQAYGGPLNSTLSGRANIGLNAFVQSFAPGTAGCSAAGCLASDSINGLYEPGQSLVGGNDRPWRLEIDVRAGDMLMLVLLASAHVAGGAGASLTMVPPSAGPLAAGQSLSFANMLQAAAPASSMTGLWLSPGLQLADTSGLVALGDGTYGFAAPVPEPATWLSLLGGLVLLGVRKGARRCARQDA